MKILADENMDGAIVGILRREGHDVVWRAETAPGAAHVDILKLASVEERIVLTFERDFGELVFHLGRSTRGVILPRLQPSSLGELLASLQAVWLRLAAAVAGHFIVVAKDKVRIRPLPRPNE